MTHRDTMVLPLDQMADSGLQSKDVTHSLEAYPISRVQCAELCEIGPAQTWSRVRVAPLSLSRRGAWR